MSYENANATKVLATHCCACGRPLVDSVSVQSGMGPDCRKKYFVLSDVPEATRIEANKLVYKLAEIVSFGSPANDIEFALGVYKLSQMGFTKLAKKIMDKMVQITVTEDGADLLVTTPYNENTLNAWRSIPGRRWDKTAKANRVPASQRESLWGLLKTYYVGKTGISSKGAFVVTG